MNLDISVGDILLGGRFKNKRIKVKSIGEDELGQPIINKGRKLLSVRIEKKLPEGMWSTKTLAEKYKDKDMDKKALLQETYDLAFEGELEKISAKGLMTPNKLVKKLTGRFSGLRPGNEGKVNKAHAIISRAADKAEGVYKSNPDWVFRTRAVDNWEDYAPKIIAKNRAKKRIDLEGRLVDRIIKYVDKG